MSARNRFAALWLVLLAFGWFGLTQPAHSQETAAEYQSALNDVHAQMNALTVELENFRVSARYCKPPQIPSKAEAQAELEALAARARALNERYAALKAGLTQLASVSGPGGYMLAGDADPTSVAFWRAYEAARRRMNDALARKRAALAAAPELDCRPKPQPKPAPAVTTGGFQPPALPARPTVDAAGWPTLPPHFCSWDDYWKFINEVINPLYNKVAEDAERVAKFRTETERAVNAYVQAGRPVPPELAARRRQAIADVEASNRRMRESEDLRNRAKAIPVIDCRTPQQEPPRTAPPQVGLSEKDISTVAGQEILLGGVEAMIAQINALRLQGKCKEMWAKLDETLQHLGTLRWMTTGRSDGTRGRAFPPEILDELGRRASAAAQPCPPRGMQRDDRPKAQPQSQPSQTGFVPPNRTMQIILEEHNSLRGQYRVAPLRWDPALASAAQSYAQQMARTGRLAHAPREGRGIARENLSQGMLHWGPREMLGNWLREKRLFRPGTYPNVSATGRWEDVSHYTQMIWPQTTALGCGMADGSGSRWLVCRYSPGGNKDGRPVGQVLGDSPRIATPPPADIAPVDSRQLPGPPPPPPPPTARDDAPDGDESKHPLVTFGNNAMSAFTEAWQNGDRAAQERELAKLRYALDELKKRLKAARKVPAQFRTVDPAKVEEQVKDMEWKLKRAEDRFHGRQEFG